MKKILLVDDQAHVLRVIKLSLDRNGYEVDTALNGEIALRMMNETEYDVLIADCDMPGMNGLELCEAVHREFDQAAPLIFLSAPEMSSDLTSWTARFPHTEFLEKPMSLRWLVARLNEFFGCYQQQLG